MFKQLDKLEYETVLDAFAGSNVVAYEFKRKNKAVTTNDFLHFSYVTSKALIENNKIIIDSDTFAQLLKLREDAPSFIRDNYTDIFFTSEECYFLDSLWKNISEIENEYKQTLAIAAVCRACQKKRPRGIFTTVGKKGWDGRRDLRISIQKQFGEAINLFNNAIFDNGQENRAIWGNIMNNKKLPVDLVYFDPPYWSPYSDNDYVRRYHFIEGFSRYWEDLKLEMRTKTKKFKSYNTPFSKKEDTKDALQKLFSAYSESIIVLSYSSNRYPTKEELFSILSEYKKQVKVDEVSYRYSFANHGNKKVKNQVKEYLFIGV